MTQHIGSIDVSFVPLDSASRAAGVLPPDVPAGDNVHCRPATRVTHEDGKQDGFIVVRPDRDHPYLNHMGLAAIASLELESAGVDPAA